MLKETNIEKYLLCIFFRKRSRNFKVLDTWQHIDGHASKHTLDGIYCFFTQFTQSTVFIASIQF